MKAKPKITVVLSDDLLCHLRRVAQARHIPLRWLVAGLVFDTFESEIDQPMNRLAALLCNRPVSLANGDLRKKADEPAPVKCNEAQRPGSLREPSLGSNCTTATT